MFLTHSKGAYYKLNSLDNIIKTNYDISFNSMGKLFNLLEKHFDNKDFIILYHSWAEGKAYQYDFINDKKISITGKIDGKPIFNAGSVYIQFKDKEHALLAKLLFGE